MKTIIKHFQQQQYLKNLKMFAKHLELFKSSSSDSSATRKLRATLERNKKNSDPKICVFIESIFILMIQWCI